MTSVLYARVVRSAGAAMAAGVVLASAACASGDADVQASGCSAPQGSQDSARGAIEAFEHAYYVERSGPAVRALATHASTVQSAELLQAYIDEIPVGTTHCLSLEPVGEAEFAVELSEIRPGTPAMTWNMVASTQYIDGLWYVDSFADAGL